MKSVEIILTGPKVCTECNILTPTRALPVLNVKVGFENAYMYPIFEVQANPFE